MFLFLYDWGYGVYFNFFGRFITFSLYFNGGLIDRLLHAWGCALGATFEGLNEVCFVLGLYVFYLMVVGRFFRVRVVDYCLIGGGVCLFQLVTARKF